MSLRTVVARWLSGPLERWRVRETAEAAAQIEVQLREQLNQHWQARKDNDVTEAIWRTRQAYEGTISKLTTLLAEKDLEINERKAGKDTKTGDKAVRKSKRKRASRRRV
jgi:1,6-anhydro-N-acetylmuramate kinase